MAKKKLPEKTYPIFKVGTPVLILRPNLWSGAAGTVKSVDAFGNHVIRVPAKPDSVVPGFTGYDASANGDELEEYI